LRRLKEIERLARERFLRLSLLSTFGGDAEVRKGFRGTPQPLFCAQGHDGHRLRVQGKRTD
jgi:hypothetical protein